MEDGEASGLAGEASLAGDVNHQLTKIAAVEHANEGLWGLSRLATHPAFKSATPNACVYNYPPWIPPKLSKIWTFQDLGSIPSRAR